MTPALSVWLDLLRTLAALGVFLGHCGWLWLPGRFEILRVYGWVDFVLLFFVLSGYVIAFVVDLKEKTPAAYALSRLARIYSVALPALVVTFVIDALGRHIRPDLYSSAWGYSSVHEARQFVRSLVFLNEVWSSRSMPGSNGPFWSLAYEVWFYIAFGLLVFVKGRKRYLAAAGAIAVVGPMVAALLPIWLMGVAAYRVNKRITIGTRLSWVMFVGSIAFIVAFEMVMHAAGLRSQQEPLFTHRWRLIEDYAIGISIACHLLGVHGVSRQIWPVLRPIARPISGVAGTSFTLYLFHFPIAQCIHVLDPWPSASWKSSILLIAGTLSLTVLVSRVTEARKGSWHRAFTHAAGLLDRMATRLRAESILLRRPSPSRSGLLQVEAATPGADG